MGYVNSLEGILLEFFWVNQNPFLKKSHEFVKGTQKIESKQLSEVPLELTGGGFKHFLFSQLLGEDSHFY